MQTSKQLLLVSCWWNQFAKLFCCYFVMSNYHFSILLLFWASLATFLLLMASVQLIDAMFAPKEVLSLSENVKKFVVDLPSNVKNSTEKYAHFIELFGTHYFADAQFGFSFRSIFDVDMITSKRTARPKFLNKLLPSWQRRFLLNLIWREQSRRTYHIVSFTSGGPPFTGL